MHRLLVVLAACSPPPPAKPPAPPPPARCIADTLGPLSDRWQPREDCDKPGPCDDACRGGDANACFNRAIALERANAPDRETMPIFQRSCTLGLALGCTNYAAAAWLTHSVPWGCLYQVFEKTCVTKDAFGCAMRGRLLIETAHDVATGRSVLERSCEELKGPPCHMLANYINDGTLEAKDPAQLGELFRRACEGGDDTACGTPAGWNESKQQ